MSMSRAQDARKRVKQGFEGSSRDAGDGEHAGDPPLIAHRGLERDVTPADQPRTTARSMPIDRRPGIVRCAQSVGDHHGNAARVVIPCPQFRPVYGFD